MKKVYVVTDDEKAFIACKSKEDAENLVKMWGKHYTYSVVEIPYIDIQEGSVIPSYPTYKSHEVEPMPFLGKPPVVAADSPRSGLPAGEASWKAPIG